jgi:hypothetical protein
MENSVINDFYIYITLENTRPFLNLFLQGLVEIQSIGGYDKAFPLFADLLEKNQELKATFDTLASINTDSSGIRTKIRISLFLLDDRVHFFTPLKNLHRDSIKACCRFLDEDSTFSKYMFNQDDAVSEILYEELLNLKKILNKK